MEPQQSAIQIWNHLLGWPWTSGMGASVAVEKVVLYNRGDFNAARTRQVEIRLAEELPTSSTTMFTGGALLGTFPGPAASGQQVDIKSGSNWATLYGRYVVVQMNNNDVLNLAEVVTYGIRLFKGKSSEQTFVIHYISSFGLINVST